MFQSLQDVIRRHPLFQGLVLLFSFNLYKMQLEATPLGIRLTPTPRFNLYKMQLEDEAQRDQSIEEISFNLYKMQLEVPAGWIGRKFLPVSISTRCN